KHGDQSIATLLVPSFDGGDEAPRGIRRERLPAQLAQRTFLLGGGDLFSLVCHHAGQEIRHRGPSFPCAALDAATRLSSRSRAAPESTDSAATSTPCRRSDTRPAAHRVAAALRSAMSR